MPVWSPRPEWLRAGVESALAQTGCAVELIVVDDGCEPPVAEYLSDVEDERLRIVRVPHGRVSRARNAGIEVARGSWIRFVDYDDVIVVDSTSHLLALADGNDRVITYGATAVCDENLRPLRSMTSDLQGRVAEACLLGRFETTIHSLLFSRAVVDDIGPWEPAIVVSQDWDYAFRGFEVAEVRGDGRIATYYRTHSGMNSRDVNEGVNGYRMVVERYFERHPDERGQSAGEARESGVPSLRDDAERHASSPARCGAPPPRTSVRPRSRRVATCARSVRSDAPEARREPPPSAVLPKCRLIVHADATVTSRTTRAFGPSPRTTSLIRKCGRRLASSYTRPRYSPIRPRKRSWMPAKNVIATMSAVNP